MNIDRFFTEHWQVIEEERISRYEEMFVWRDAQIQLLAPAEIGPGQRVLDIGSGPGFFAFGLGKLVGETGHVHGVDINERFVRDANTRAKDQSNISFQHVSNHELPFPEQSFDRVICKNVLEYVPDLSASAQVDAAASKPPHTSVRHLDVHPVTRRDTVTGVTGAGDRRAEATARHRTNHLEAVEIERDAICEYGERERIRSGDQEVAGQYVAARVVDLNRKSCGVAREAAGTLGAGLVDLTNPIASRRVTR